MAKSFSNKSCPLSSQVRSDWLNLGSLGKDASIRPETSDIFQMALQQFCHILEIASPAHSGGRFLGQERQEPDQRSSHRRSYREVYKPVFKKLSKVPSNDVADGNQ